MAQFDSAIATALRLIQKNGQMVTWRQQQSVATKAWLPVGTDPIDFNPYICFLPLEKEGKEFLYALGQAEAVSGSMYGLMGAVGFTPRLKDVVIRNGVQLDINSIDLLAPNGQKILYTIVFNE